MVLKCQNTHCSNPDIDTIERHIGEIEDKCRAKQKLPASQPRLPTTRLSFGTLYKYLFVKTNFGTPANSICVFCSMSIQFQCPGWLSILRFNVSARCSFRLRFY